MWFASNGYVCLIVDTLQLGEVAGIHHGTYREGRWWWHDRGYTPAGVECWNGIRGIDYLVSRPDVDPERIGVTGISGGGATTVWIAAADERVKVAVPVSGMSDLESYVTNKVINGHCDCMFLVNTYQWEWTTILALFAPRPLLFANSDNDTIFPMDGNRRIIERLRKCYEMYGKKDNCRRIRLEGRPRLPARPAARDLRLHQQAPARATTPDQGRRLRRRSRARTCASSPRTRICRRTRSTPRWTRSFVPKAEGEVAGGGEGVQGVEGGADEETAGEELPGAAGEGAGCEAYPTGTG